MRPDDLTALYQMAQLAKDKGSDEEAVGLLERVIKQDPYLIPAHVLLARLYGKLNHTADFERERAEIDRLNKEEQRLYEERQKTQPATQTEQTQPTTTPSVQANSNAKPKN